MLLGALAEHTAQRRDVLVEVVLLDDHVRPDRFDEGGLVEQLPGVLEEELQEVECSGVNGQGSAVGAHLQRSLADVDPKLTEFVADRVRLLAHSGLSTQFTTLQGLSKSNSDAPTDCSSRDVSAASAGTRNQLFQRE